jgi:hypothetical protein
VQVQHRLTQLKCRQVDYGDAKYKALHDGFLNGADSPTSLCFEIPAARSVEQDQKAVLQDLYKFLQDEKKASTEKRKATDREVTEKMLSARKRAFNQLQVNGREWGGTHHAIILEVRGMHMKCH